VHVGEICRAALERPGDDFLAWARQRFGQAAPTAQPPFSQTFGAQSPASASIPAAAPVLAAGSGPVAKDPAPTPKPRGKKRTSATNGQTPGTNGHSPAEPS